MSAVEQYARAHIVTDADIPDDTDAVPVVLRYDPETDPRSVRIGLPGPHEWTFSRTLLEQGLREPAGTGEVKVWPLGRVQAVVEFHSAAGVSVVQFDTKTLMRFLRRTYLAGGRPTASPRPPEPDLTQPDLTEPHLPDPDLTEPHLPDPDLTEPDLSRRA